MPNDYVIEPEWAVWMVLLEMFVAGVAAGTYLFIVLANLTARRGAAGEADRRAVAALGFIPAPLMLVAAVLLIFDLGEPDRFANLFLRSPFAPERGPLPTMLNPNSPMSWASYILPVFGLATAIAFLDAWLHTRVREGRRASWNVLEGLAHNPVVLVVGGIFAMATAGYSGVMLSVTSQPVWQDSWMLGALFIAFSALSGMAVAAIAADRLRATQIAEPARSGLVMYAAVCGALLLIFVIWVAIAGNGGPLVASLLTGPVFWIGVVGAAILYPIVVLTRGAGLMPRTVRGGDGARLAVGMLELDRLLVVGVVVLLGALAFRYAILWSAVAALH
jgi:hypothetical protein